MIVGAGTLAVVGAAAAFLVAVAAIITSLTIIAKSPVGRPYRDAGSRWLRTQIRDELDATIVNSNGGKSLRDIGAALSRIEVTQGEFHGRLDRLEDWVKERHP